MRVIFAAIHAEADGRLGAPPFTAGKLLRVAEGAALPRFIAASPLLCVYLGSAPRRER